MMRSVTAAKRLGEALVVLTKAGVTDEGSATNALLLATLAGGTPERAAALAAFRDGMGYKS